MKATGLANDKAHTLCLKVSTGFVQTVYALGPLHCVKTTKCSSINIMDVNGLTAQPFQGFALPLNHDMNVYHIITNIALFLSGQRNT